MSYYILQAGFIGQALITGNIIWWGVAIAFPLIFFGIMSLTGKKA